MQLVFPRRRPLWLVAAMAVSLGAAGCSSDPAPLPDGSAAEAPTSRPPQPTGTSKPATPESLSIIAAAGEALPSDETQVACILARLDADPTLRNELGADPIRSPRLDDLMSIAGDCLNDVVFATQFAENLALGNPEVDATKQDCIRQEVVALTADEYNSLITAGLDPATDDGTARRLLEGIFEGCGVDPATINAPGP